MLVEKNVPLQHCNTFGIAARADTLVRIRHQDDIRQFLADPLWGRQPVFVLGGGSNVVLTGDVGPVVLKMEIMGMRLLRETDKHWIVEIGAGERWHDMVAWTLSQGYSGLENMALIPGTVGAAPVQNIGAYGLELQDRFDSLDAVDLVTGEQFSLNAAQCAFAYRDSVFKHAPAQPKYWQVTGAESVPRGLGLKGRAVITQVRLALPKTWKPDLGYLDLQRKQAEKGIEQPSAQQIFDWVCEIRQAKLPDPEVIGNAGSFFKNPIIAAAQAEHLLAEHPGTPCFRGNSEHTRKLSAAWLIDQCGFKGHRDGDAGVSSEHALVLVNHGHATGLQLLALARRIAAAVHARFGVMIEPEPRIIGAVW